MTCSDNFRLAPALTEMQVHQFWTSPDPHVPPYVTWSVTTLRRHHAHVLWTFNDRLDQLPPGTEVRRADDFMPRAEFDALVAACDGQLSDHQKRAVASDVVRVRLLRHLQAQGADAVAYVDADVLGVRPLPVPAETAIFTCNPAKRTGSMASKRRELADVATTDVPYADDAACFREITGHEHFSNSVWMLRLRHPAVRAFLERLAIELLDVRKYNQAMHIANRLRREHRLGSVLPFALVHPLPWFNVARCCKAGSDAGFTTYGARTPAAAAILQHAYTVEIYGSKVDLAVLTNVPSDSMMGHLIKRIT